MKVTVSLPDLGDMSTDAVVLEWLVRPGEDVEADQPLLTVETDKTNVDVPAPAAGRVNEFLVQPDDEVAVGAALAVIETS